MCEIDLAETRGLEPLQVLPRTCLANMLLVQPDSLQLGQVRYQSITDFPDILHRRTLCTVGCWQDTEPRRENKPHPTDIPCSFYFPYPSVY
jgi:hypothetical protein